MRTIIFFSFLIACSDNSSLGRVCPSECYSGAVGTKDVGICRAGKPVCNERMEIIDCFGEVLPEQEEICSGKDEDCSGLSDDYIYPLRSYSFQSGQYGLDEYPCLSLGECRNGRAECVNGSWKCIYLPTVELNSDGNVTEKETLCDQKDGDCDGRTDEDLFIGQYCYEGEIGTEIYPPCHPGSLLCRSGNVECVNQVIPSPEICGDQVDNDCDGVINNTTIALNTDFDIVFLVDTSGSMAYTISSVAGALDAYSEQFDGNEHYRFALVLMAAPVGTLVQIDTDFTDFVSIRSRIQSLQDNGSGAEASLDAMLEICQQSNPLFLSWRPEAKRLLFTFTDEPPQTYMTTRTNYQMVSDACIASQTTLVIWSENEPEFRPIAENSGGVYFELINDWQIMFNEMNSIIFSFCE